MTTRKKDHPDNIDQAKARLLIRDWGGKFDYQQIKGKPPKPQDAPLAKHTKNIYRGRKSNKGKGREKSGKAKTSKGSAQAALAAPRHRDSYKDSKYSKDSCNSRYHKRHKDSCNSRSNSRNRQLQQPQQHRVSKRPHSEHANRSDCDSGVFQPKETSSKAATQQTTCSPNAPTSKRPERSSKSSTATKSKAKHSLPAPWEEHWSEEHRLSYFWNSTSGESTWHRPCCGSVVQLD